jgi:hypothetical protein
VGKKADLSKLFESYQSACVQMRPLGWSAWTSGAKRTAANALWLLVRAPTTWAATRPYFKQLDRVVKVFKPALLAWIRSLAGEACGARAGLRSMMKC